MTTSDALSMFPLSYILVNPPSSGDTELRQKLNFLWKLGYRGIDLDFAGVSGIGLEWQEAARSAIEYLAGLFLPETTKQKQEH